jgi:DNA mismatch repair ATPase MutL
MSRKSTPDQNIELFSFSTNFLRDHAGHIITDPRTAITELIANAYDAGATAVDITWPDDSEGPFVIADNGTGMTKAESLLFALLTDM